MEIDDLIDGALKSYVAPEPRGGLENRIQNRVRAEGQPKPIIPRWLVLAIPILACAVFVVVSRGPRAEKVRFVAHDMHSGVQSVSPELEAPVVMRRVKHMRSSPKRLVFPSASALSNEEQALIRFVNAAPSGVLDGLIDQQGKDAVPIQIDDLRIEPLNSSIVR